MFEVKIYTSNDTFKSESKDAFMDNYALANELEKILRTIPAKITCGYRNGCLFDSNGNLVGEWRTE
jgi:hypothetical protein